MVNKTPLFDRLKLKSEWYFDTLDIYRNISLDLCQAQNRSREFQRCICSCVVNLAMTSDRLSFASVEIDKNYSLTLPWWKHLCHRWSRDQPQREAQNREPENLARGPSWELYRKRSICERFTLLNVVFLKWKVKLTSPRFFCIASKCAIFTLDHCQRWSPIVTTSVKVGRSPTITRSPI